MDTELFDLCKEVYKRTGWGGTQIGIAEFFKDKPFVNTVHNLIRDGYSVEDVTPLYTSDYLLEKLPKRSELIEHTAMLGRGTNNVGWSIVYKDFVCLADTPAKALLKLIIALDDAGELR